MITLISAWDKNCADLADVTWPNKVAYCNRHGYPYATQEDYQSDRRASWGKWDLGRRLLADTDWVFLLDVDTLITNPLLKLEEFIDPAYDLIASYDVNGLNTGGVFVKNSHWGRTFLNQLWDDGHRFGHYTNPEQTTLAYLLYKEPKEKWLCVPQRRFNSFRYNEYGGAFDYPEGDWRPGDFLLHLPAIPNERRIKVFKEMLPQSERM